MNHVITRTISGRTDPQILIRQILSDRGIADPELFMNPPHPSTIETEQLFDDPVLFREHRQVMLDLLKKLQESQQPIVVYMDYDADGITGGAIMWQTLHAIGFKVVPYIPDRKTEGYGFSKKGLDAVISEHSPGLIISVDHGIVGHEQITYAKSQGVPVIVTDHHQKSDTVPADALAIFHTSKVSGSGVSYFIAREISQAFEFPEKYAMFEKDFLAIAAIGTIADMVPLTGEARSIAKYGLNAFEKIQNPGLRALFKEAGIQDKKITSYEVGFVIAPRINAFGRIEHGMDALRLLCTTSMERAEVLAKKAKSVNTKRQDIVTDIYKQVIESVDTKKKLLISIQDDIEEGIIGLLAGKLTALYHLPAIVITTNGSGIAKASARSPEGFDIVSFLRNFPEFFESLGGHAGAAGFSIKEENLEEVVRLLQEEGEKKIPEDIKEKVLHVDLSIPLSAITKEFVSLLGDLEPFGMGNPEPLFLSVGRIVQPKKIGKDGKHLSFGFLDEDGGSIQCVWFNNDNHSIREEDRIIYTLNINSWNGRESIQGKVLCKLE